MQDSDRKHVVTCELHETSGSLRGWMRQSGSCLTQGILSARHSGMHCLGFLVGCSLLLAAAAAQREGLEVLLRDGTVVKTSALVGDLASGLELHADGGKRRVAIEDLVAVLGGGAARPTLSAAHLAGGEVVCGEVVGGDQAGHRLELQSPVFGRLGFDVDRLLALAAPGVQAPQRLQLPTAVEEALFVRAKVGFDVLAGTLHQFGEQGVRFQPDGAAAPRWYRVDDFVALRLSGATARPTPAAITLLTRVGDRVRVDLVRWGADRVMLQLEGKVQVTVAVADVAAMSFHQGVVFVSDLPTAAVAEAGFDGEVVYPFQRDHNVLGEPLVSGGRAHGKGLGVHSRSSLAFVVPPGCERFWTRVAFDDSAAALGLEPRANVQVLVGDQVVFAHQDLAAGQAPLDTGLVVVKPGQTVTLQVEPGRGRDLGDRVNWLSPVFLPAPRRS